MFTARDDVFQKNRFFIAYKWRVINIAPYLNLIYERVLANINVLTIHSATLFLAVHSLYVNKLCMIGF